MRNAMSTGGTRSAVSCKTTLRLNNFGSISKYFSAAYLKLFLHFFIDVRIVARVSMIMAHRATQCTSYMMGEETDSDTGFTTGQLFGLLVVDSSS